MTVRDVVQKLDLGVLTAGLDLERGITGGYASDLLSDVIANSEEGNLWVTLQTHDNIVAIATLKDLCAVVLVNGRRPDAETVAKAREEKVILLSTPLPAFELIGRLYQAGIRGSR